MVKSYLMKFLGIEKHIISNFPNHRSYSDLDGRKVGHFLITIQKIF